MDSATIAAFIGLGLDLVGTGVNVGKNIKANNDKHADKVEHKEMGTPSQPFASANTHNLTPAEMDVHNLTPGEMKMEKPDVADSVTDSAKTLDNIDTAVGTAKKVVDTTSNVIKTVNDNNKRSAQMVPVSNRYQASNIASDERLKEAVETEDPIDVFAQIDAYLYKYTPEAQRMYGENGTVNDEGNFGVMAQDLAKNPLTQAAVKEDENGYLMLDGGRLSSINTAMIAELCKKVQELESVVYGNR